MTYARILTEEDAAEYERLGREYDELQSQAGALVRKMELTEDELEELHNLTKRQVELHAARMALLR